MKRLDLNELVDCMLFTWEFTTAAEKGIVITLWLLADHEGRERRWKGKEITLEPGQVIMTVEELRRKCGIRTTTGEVRGMLSRFDKCGLIKIETSKKGKLITITNWDKYTTERG